MNSREVDWQARKELEKMMHLQCTHKLNPQILRNRERHINNNFKY